LPSAEQSGDRLVWIEEEPIVPEPVLLAASAQSLLRKIG